MMRFGVILLVGMLVGVMMPTRPAWAVGTDGALMTGKALALFCTSTKEEDQFACQSYLAGVIDYHRLVRSMNAGPAIDFCLPPGLPMATVKGLVVNYLTRYTEHKDFIAAPAIPMALSRAYPCTRKRR